jgi:hypothetical protein
VALPVVMGTIESEDVWMYRVAPLALGLVTGGMTAAVVVLLWRRGRVEKSASEADQWERDRQHRRRKEAVYGGASYVLLFVCAAVAAALSFHGLVGFGRQNLNLSGGWEYLVPFGLDGAAMFCSVLAVREASHGDAAFGSRVLVWGFAGAAAWFNWVHAPRGTVHAGAPQFFAGMSIAAAVLFDRALKQTRKAALRERNLVARPLPQIRMARWLRAPRETYGAWSLMLLEGVPSLDEAVDLVRDDRDEKARTKARSKTMQKQLPAAEQNRVTLERVASLPQRDEPAGGPSRPIAIPGAPSTDRADRAGGYPASGAPIDLSDDDARQGQDLQTLEERLRALEKQFD